jgi:hypothetical protein
MFLFPFCDEEHIVFFTVFPQNYSEANIYSPTQEIPSISRSRNSIIFITAHVWPLLEPDKAILQSIILFLWNPS